MSLLLPFYTKIWRIKFPTYCSSLSICYNSQLLLGKLDNRVIAALLLSYKPGFSIYQSARIVNTTICGTPVRLYVTNPCHFVVRNCDFKRSVTEFTSNYKQKSLNTTIATKVRTKIPKVVKHRCKNAKLCE